MSARNLKTVKIAQKKNLADILRLVLHEHNLSKQKIVDYQCPYKH